MLAELQWNLTDRNLSKTQRERPENTHPSPTPRRVGHPKNLRLVRNSMGGLPALRVRVKSPTFRTARKVGHPQNRTGVGSKGGPPALCGAGQGCRGRILERLYIDNCLPLTVELFHQLAFFILSCKPISYCRFKRIEVYIL
jgi:hypothetical protein